MRDLAKTFSPMLWIIACVLLMVRTGDAHLHLCFDGQEPPRTLHVGDESAAHHSDDGQSDHTDADVDAVDVALAKKAVDTNDAIPFRLATLILLLPVPDRSIDPPLTAQDPPPLHPYLFRPPLRGPPA